MYFPKLCLGLVLGTTLIFSAVLSDTCVEQKDSCVQDCDCCGYGTISGVVCQTRRHQLGPRCHIFRRHGESCAADDECR